jgi:hypothetical protein
MSEESFILNLDEVKQSLLDLPDEIVRDTFADALRAGAGVVESELRARTPLGADDKEQEHLRDAIETKVSVDTLDGSAETGFGDLGYRAVFVEYGTSNSCACPPRCTSKSGLGIPASNLLALPFTSAAIIFWSAPMKYSSLPSRLHTGAVPPLVDTCHLPPGAGNVTT